MELKFLIFLLRVCIVLPWFCLQLSSSSSTDSAINSPNKLPNSLSTPSFPLQPQQPASSVMSNTALHSPSASVTSKSATQQLGTAGSTRGQQRGDQPPQGEQSWDSHIDKHIQKSLQPQNKVSLIALTGTFFLYFSLFWVNYICKGTGTSLLLFIAINSNYHQIYQDGQPYR